MLGSITLNPDELLVVLLIQEYVYELPFPPVGVLALICEGVDPLQIVCALPVMLLLAISSVTVNVHTLHEVASLVPFTAATLHE